MEEALQPVASPLSRKYSPSRRRVYVLLVVTEGQPWTIGELVVALARLGPTSSELVRSTLFMLAADRIVRVVPRGTGLTFVLTVAGAGQIRSILRSWQTAGHVVPLPRLGDSGQVAHRRKNRLAPKR